MRCEPRAFLSIIAVAAWFTPLAAAEKPLTTTQLAAKIDGFVESYWSASGIQHSEPASDAEFLRRGTLDLVGRIPTVRELEQFQSEKSSDRRAKLIQRLLDSPEFPLHLGSVLDGMIQGRHAGHEPFVDYLRRSVRDGKPWDAMFRELMTGPWDTDERKPANRFLDRRARTLDVLTADATRIFFGVDISCAKCHDHPLVEDWTQDHFYGMASFFNRTTGGKGKVGEKKDGDVKFPGADGKEKTARVMFLSGAVVDQSDALEPETDSKAKPKPASRREQLVKIALEERKFFSRSFVNRTWHYLFGRGIVHPVDQMHSANAPSIPGLLEWLADDFAEGGYDLRRLIQSLVSSKAYQLSSVWPHETDLAKPESFAVARLRPLSRRQLSFSILLATGHVELSEPDDLETRVERYLNASGAQRVRQYLLAEQQASEVAGSLDRQRDDFQSSAGEALFLSNNELVQKLFQSDGEANSLVRQLSETNDTKKLVRTAVQSVLAREPRDGEMQRLCEWYDSQSSDRAVTAGQLLWVLVTSAEFRFNH